MSEPITITLSRPIQAHGTERTHLELRESRPSDVWDLSLQIGGGGLTLIYGDLMTFAGRLAEIPASSLRALAPADCGALLQAALPFLVPFLAAGSALSEN